MQLLMSEFVQEAKGAETATVAAAKELLQDIKQASSQGIVYFRGRATVFAKPGTHLLSKLVWHLALLFRCLNFASQSFSYPVTTQAEMQFIFALLHLPLSRETSAATCRQQDLSRLIAKLHRTVAPLLALQDQDILPTLQNTM